MKRVWSLGDNGLCLDGSVDYMDVRSVGHDLLVSAETFETVCGYSDAIDLMFGLVRRGLPAGTHQLPLSGAFADAARLEGRYRELVAARS